MGFPATLKEVGGRRAVRAVSSKTLFVRHPTAPPGGTSKNERGEARSV